MFTRKLLQVLKASFAAIDSFCVFVVGISHTILTKNKNLPNKTGNCYFQMEFSRFTSKTPAKFHKNNK